MSCGERGVSRRVDHENDGINRTVYLEKKRVKIGSGIRLASHLAGENR